MKTSGVIAALVLGALALGLTVWIGRYQAKTDVLVPQSKPTLIDPGPELSKEGPHPKAVADVTEHDFGRMALHQKGEHKFTIKNEGKADLKLVARKEDATCQCTLGELADGDTVPPGESRDVTLSWHIKVMVESFRHSAKIRTNDPDNRIIEFVVKGKVDMRFKMTPGDVWEVGELSRTEPTRFTGTIHSNVIEKFDIKGTRCQNDKVKVTYEPLSPEALAEKEATSGYAFHVEVAPGVPIGPFYEDLFITTDDEDMPELHVKLQGRMIGPIEFLGPAYRAESNLLSFGEFKATEGKEVTLSLFVRDLDEELELVGTDPPSDRIVFELKKGEQLAGKTRRYQLKAKVLPGDPIDLLRGPAMKTSLKFNHPEAENVQLQIRMLAI